MSTPAPHSLEAERAVLGSVMLDNTTIDELAHLPAEAFYAERHRVLWSTINRLNTTGSSVDLVTLTDDLRVKGNLERVGSAPYLMGLLDATPTAAYVHDYARTVLQHHERRRLIHLCLLTAKNAGGADPIDAILETHEAELTNLSRYQALERGPNDYHREALDLITGANAATTGFVDLDQVLGGGLVRGGYNVIAARPSMGKSALLRRVLTHRASRGETCSLFSIDQGGGDVYALEAAMRARTPLFWYRPDRRGRIRAGSEHRARLEAELDHLRDVWSERVRIHDSRAELNSILAQARADIRDGSTIIAIDHAQSIMVDGKSDETNVVSRVSRSLKAVCREYNVTLVLLSQLGRALESRDDKRPRLSDLRQSGAIEEDANSVLFLFRDDYYQALIDPRYAPTNIAEVIVAKNKLGPVPQIAKLTWRPEYAAFEDMATVAQQHRAETAN
ncbi:MAG: hypothetical protein H0X64_06440 [Gemmatimonadaceae bacterium]|nr:hypothetical protein [Gemmatimonadaceae bacterium]